MPIGIHEQLLPGQTITEKIQTAQALGFDGVEFDATGLRERVPDIVAALGSTGIQAAAVNLGRRDGYIAPDLHTRESAISAMRVAMADSVDIGANRVIFVPHYGDAKMPDLTPYKSPIELAAEMMVWLLRTVSDLAYAIGIDLYMQPRREADTYFMNHLRQAAYFRKKIKDHAHVKIAPHLFHLMHTEDDVMTALREHSGGIGYLHIADSGGGLPGTGTIDYAVLAETLQAMDYDGWLTIACDDLMPDRDSLVACLVLLRAKGLQ